jgi:hypothetical protein
VLKGTVKPPEILYVQWIAPAALNGSRDLKGHKGIFFLQKSQAGRWQLLPAMGGDVVFDLAVLPATNGAIAPDLQYAPAASMDGKLLLELAAVVENKDGGAFALDYMAGPDPGGVAALSGVYRRFSQSSSIDLKAYGIAGLIRRGDVQVLSQLLADVSVAGAGTSSNSVVSSLCQYSNANPMAVSILGALSRSPVAIPRLQFCAAAALRAIHTKETPVYLQALLDSP